MMDATPSKRAAIANPDEREFLRKADPVLARLIDAQPGFRPRAWMDDLPPLDAFATLVFEVAGQQVSVPGGVSRRAPPLGGQAVNAKAGVNGEALVQLLFLRTEVRRRV